MNQICPFAVLLVTVVACSSTPVPQPHIHDHSLGDFDLCTINIAYQVSPSGEFQLFEILEPVTCHDKVVVLSDAYKLTACRNFWASGSHAATYQENESPTAIIGIIAFMDPATIDARRPTEAAQQDTRADAVKVCSL